MERPDNFGEREFLNAQEIAAASAPSPVAENVIGEEALLPEGEVGKSYDDFWNEQTGFSDSIRTSHNLSNKRTRTATAKWSCCAVWY